MPTISVIIPTYGTPTFLEDSIKSVQRQTFTDWELIIVDDNNPDTDARNTTEKIVSRYIDNDKRIKYIKHSKNRNGAAARNTGFAIAQGKFIAFLDSDDEYMPNRLQKCYDALLKAPKVIAGVYTGCEFRRSRKTYLRYTDVVDGNFLIETLACKFMFCTGSNIFIRKDVVDELNGFDETFLRHQDYEFLVRVFERYSLKAIQEILVIKNNENINVPKVEKQISIKKQYLDKYHYLIEKLSQKEVKHIMHANYIGIAEIAMAQNEFKVARIYYNMAQKNGGLSIKEWSRRLIFPLYNLLRR